MSTPPPKLSRPPGKPRKNSRSLPGGIWALGFGSLLMDTSSELIHSLLPIYMSSVLGASIVTIGFIEGVAEAAAAITKVFSGSLSDYLKKRKFMVVFGYVLSALTKPVFPLASSIAWVFGARFTDRIGKGIRGAPRDALVADITPPSLRGAAYGLRQALDSTGALLGPLLALIFMVRFAGDIKQTLWVAVVPGLLAPLLLFIAVAEPAQKKESFVHAPRKPAWAHLKSLPFRYWGVVFLGTLFSLSRFSEAFLVLRAQDIGLQIAYVPMVLIVINLFYSAFAYPAGAASDRLPARRLLLFGLTALIAADLLLAMSASKGLTLAGAAFWGLHMALTQGLFSKLVADTAPVHLRATAFGVFNTVTGVMYFPASVIAGTLWRSFGPPAAFFAGAALAALVSAGLLLYRRR